MTEKERVSAALNHQEPDKIPIDFGGTADAHNGAHGRKHCEAAGNGTDMDRFRGRHDLHLEAKRRDAHKARKTDKRYYRPEQISSGARLHK